MVAVAEITACLIAMAVAFKLATVECRRLRKSRQMSQALRIALTELC